MNRFSLLLEQIIYSPSRNRKIELMSNYFRNTIDPDRGYSLAILTGNLKFNKLTSSKIKEITKKKVDHLLFDLSYDYVGDLAETVSLIWPKTKKGKLPKLSNFIKNINKLQDSDVEEYFLDCLCIANKTERWAIIKLLSGGLRIGVSERLAKTSLSRYSNIPLEKIEKIWHGLNIPYINLFAWLDGKVNEPKINNYDIFHPLMLSNTINVEKDFELLDPNEYIAEWKWDGIRVQIIISRKQIKIFSRNGENITKSFPELNLETDNDVVIDGELLVGKNFIPNSFNDLQKRLNRKIVSSKHIDNYTSFIRAYDIIFFNKRDLRTLNFNSRRSILENWFKKNPQKNLDLSLIIKFKNWNILKKKREKAIKSFGYEGIMIKNLNSPYLPGRPQRMWYKWKRDPKLIDTILMYAQRGHGKRSSFYSDYTFGVWNKKDLVPIGKAYSGFTNDELNRLDKFVRKNTLKKFGPVREVEKKLVLEIAFDEINESSRHKSGIALRFPRISNIRWDKPVQEVEQLNSIKKNFNLN